MEKELCWGFVGLLFLAIFASASMVGTETGSDKPIVKIATGKVQGSQAQSRTGQPYFEFRGIPYAIPPVGPLRYQPPQAAQSWEGIKDASDYGSKCLQFDLLTDLVFGTEDCLFVNVMTSSEIPSKVLNPVLKPVLVYVHGGQFMYGSSNEFNAQYWMDHPIVVVTLNYRLNSFGFLNIDGFVDGNMGLKDQNLALRWVKTNIDKFGGDPSRVTLAGQSAGGASVHYQLLSPASQGLFQKAISFSGTVLNPWAFTKEPLVKAQAIRFGKNVNCSTDTSESLHKCLLSLDARALIIAHQETRSLLAERQSFFTPTKESIKSKEPFLTETPHKLVEEGKGASKVPWMTGVNSADGLIFLMVLFMTPNDTIRLNSDWNVVAPRLYGFDELADAHKERIAKKLHTLYLHDKAFSEEDFQDLLQLFSDAGFNNGFQTSAIAHSKHQLVYPYYYNYNGTFGFYQSFLSMSHNGPKVLDWAFSLANNWWGDMIGTTQVHRGACHGDEMAMLWMIPFLVTIVNEDTDYHLSRVMVQSLVDFATNEGDPTMNGVKWTPLSKDSSKETPLKMMLIGNKSEMIEEPFFKTVSMWDKEIAPEILKPQ